MTKTEYCIVCLSTDVKLYIIKDYSLGEIYSDLTRIPVSNWNQYLCVECASLIQKYNKFKLKCIHTNNVLSTNIHLSGLTKSALKTIQETFKIGSILAYSEVTTEDVTESDPDCANIDKIKIEHNTDNNISCSIDRNDNGLFIAPKNEAYTLPIEYSEEKLSISHMSTDKSAETHQSLDSKDAIGHFKDASKVRQLSISNADQNKRLKDKEKETNLKNFSKKKNLNKVQKVNHKRNVRKTTDQVKRTGELIPKKDKARSSRTKSKLTIRRKPSGLTIAEHTAELIKNIEKQGHTVQFLTQEEAKSEVLNRANCDNYTKSPYKCDLCYRGFLREATLANHMVKHSPQKGTYTCAYCHYRYPKKFFLNSHMRTAHTTKFRCSLCPFVCDLNRASDHLRFHDGKTHDCKFCDKKFSTQSSLTYHIHLKHQDEFKTQYICEFCGNSFLNKTGLNQHKDKVHFNESNEKLGPACEQCGIHFASQQAWDRHLVVSNNHLANSDVILEKPKPGRKKSQQVFTCEFCGHEFAFEYYYKMHLHKHHDQPKPEYKKNTSKNIICEICGAKFRADWLLKRHSMKHTGELPYKCQYCDKKYRVQAMLKLHENSHTRANIYKCDVCNKEFLLPSSHARHMKIHIGFAPHKCLECDQSFINKSTLNAHIKHKHQKIPYPKKNKDPERKRQRQSKSYAFSQTQDEEK